MIAVLLVFCLICTALVLPGWLWARRTRPQGASVLFLPALGIAVWVALAAAGIGAQSLSNLVEVLYVGALAVLVAYARIFPVERSDRLRPYGSAAAFGLVIAFAVALRILMPAIPE